MVVNRALKEHQDDSDLKQGFGYFCPIIFEYVDVDDDLWPRSEEFVVMQDFPANNQ